MLDNTLWQFSNVTLLVIWWRGFSAWFPWGLHKDLGTWNFWLLSPINGHKVIQCVAIVMKICKIVLLEAVNSNHNKRFKRQLDFDFVTWNSLNDLHIFADVYGNIVSLLVGWFILLECTTYQWVEQSAKNFLGSEVPSGLELRHKGGRSAVLLILFHWYVAVVSRLSTGRSRSLVRLAKCWLLTRRHSFSLTRWLFSVTFWRFLFGAAAEVDKRKQI